MAQSVLKTPSKGSKKAVAKGAGQKEEEGNLCYHL